MLLSRQLRKNDQDREVEIALSFLKSALADCQPRRFAVRLWDGTLLGPDEGHQASFTMVLNHPGALRRMFLQPNQLSLGEAFIYKDFDIEGDLTDSFALGEFLMSRHAGIVDRLRCGRFLLALPAGQLSGPGRGPARLNGELHSKQRDRNAVTYHYNVSNDFYRLWLDERMVYSCAYFASHDDSLEAAQERKLDYICRKLRLKPGERFLDIGCGWGGLITHAARKYGVEAVGITLSLPQATLATERIKAAGLADRCRVEVRDYRDLNGAESYDKVASIGMFEHVGKKQLQGYFSRAFHLLKPGGAFLNHGIAANVNHPCDEKYSFIDRYVFPDGDLLPVNSTLDAAECCGFEVRDLESMREHYALTLRHWVRRLENRFQEAVAVTDETTCRIWRLYMAGSAFNFDRGWLNVYQALLVKPDQGRSRQPLTRADWYPLP